MTIRVKDFREALVRMAQKDGATDADMLVAINEFLGQISVHDEMDLSEFFQLFRPKRRRRAPELAGQGRATPASAADLAAKLRAVLENDAAFDAEFSKIENSRSVTKPVLVSLYETLFGSTAGIPKKASRAELLRLISDERLVAVRDAKTMHAMKRRPVPAS